MELLYLYVSKYNGLENKEFNFSSKYKIHYNNELKSIECVNDTELPKDFWPDSIRSVTGIIGKNGAGKTTLIRLLLRSCISEGLSEEPENVIVAFKEKSNSKNISFYCHNNIEVTSYPDYFQSDETPRLSDVTFIYHSNHFDPYSSPLDLTKEQLMGMINLGTNYLLERDKETYTNRDKNNLRFSFQKAIALHRAMELRRQINFIRKYKNEKEIAFISVPDYLRITPNHEEEEWLCSDDEPIIATNCKKVVDIFNQVQKLFGKKNKRDLFYFEIFRTSIFNLYNDIKASWGLDIYLNQFTSMLVLEFQKLLINDKLISNSNYFLIYDKIIESFPTYKFIKKNKSDLEGLFKILNESEIPEFDDFAFLDLKKNQITTFNKFFDQYFSDERITSFVNFELSHDPYSLTTPSSGELALFNFFSRFSSIKKHELKNNIIILLDEVELALHPEWQRKYINTILTFFNKEFGTKRRKIQLIITSHSPFVVSDLPKSCINFLNGRIISQETFGANIYNLFMDAFFLEEGLIGEFAKNKIFALLDQIESSEDILKNKDFLEMQINLIGEPLIKERLTEELIKKLTKSELAKRQKQLIRELKFIEIQIDSNRNEEN